MEFRLLVARLFQIPVTERSIEAKHALVRMALYDYGLKGSTVNNSFSSRLLELRNRLERGLVSVAGSCWIASSQLADNVRVPSSLGMELHPIFVGLWSNHHTQFT